MKTTGRSISIAAGMLAGAILIFTRYPNFPSRNEA